jgi:hypothetical protein
MHILELVRPTVVLAPRPINASPARRMIPTIHMRSMAAHGYLVVFQVACSGAPRSSILRRIASGSAAAKLGSDSEDIPQDVFEEGFEGRDGGCDEACVELGADPDCEAGAVVCENHETLFCQFLNVGRRMHLQVGLVDDPSLGSSVHLARAQTVASRPIMNTLRRAHLL